MRGEERRVERTEEREEERRGAERTEDGREGRSQSTAVWNVIDFLQTWKYARVSIMDDFCCLTAVAGAIHRYGTDRWLKVAVAQ